MNNPEEVRRWSSRYPVIYDATNYDPYIQTARSGSVTSLRKVTEWKNPGRGDPPSPMRLSANKEKAFQSFLKNLDVYLRPGGSIALKANFPVASPVYAIFWHHVLFATPIFDIHTNRAFHFFTEGVLLRGKNAAVPRGGHWQLYGRYSTWFAELLVPLQTAGLTERHLDRALMQWGIANQ